MKKEDKTYRFIDNECYIAVDSPNHEVVSIEYDKKYDMLYLCASYEIDLAQSKQYLRLMQETTDDTAKIAFVKMAILNLVKCYTTGNDGRKQLNPIKVFEKYSFEKYNTTYIDDYNKIKDLRNQIIAHNSNEYKMCNVILVLNKTQRNIEEITTVGFTHKYNYDTVAKLVGNLISLTKEYIKEQKERNISRIYNEYKDKEFDELIKLKKVKIGQKKCH